MPKVREVLEKIGDEPLITVLDERGYVVLQPSGQSDRAAREYLEDSGYCVLADFDRDGLERGYELYRNRKTEEFRQWLRDLFWNGIGRIV